MSFDWKQFLNLALYLQSVKPAGFCKESAQRTAVSRTYFAAYGYATNYAIQKFGFAPSTDPTLKYQDHGRLRDCYQHRGRGKIAFELGRLRENRNKCDYDDQVNDLPTIEKNSFDLVGSMLGKLN
jgi:hypothetical protein